MENDMVKNKLINQVTINEHIFDKLDSRIDSSGLSKNRVQLLLQEYDYNFDFPLEELINFPIEEIIDYIKLSHQYYLSKKLPEIEQSISNLKKHHFESNKLLVLLTIYFEEYRTKFIKHLQFEELTLIPYIQNLVDENQSFSNFNLSVFIAQHTDIEKDLEEIRNKILDFSRGEKTPLAFNIFMNQLQVFEIDLCKHALVEDLILIPKALELERNVQ